MARETFKEIWESINAEVLPTDAGPIQREETKKAFYAGLRVAIERFLALGEDDSLDEDAACDLLEADRLEIAAFFKTEVGSDGTGS